MGFGSCWRVLSSRGKLFDCYFIKTIADVVGSTDGRVGMGKFFYKRLYSRYVRFCVLLSVFMVII